ncbi:MAG: class I SAM-dependent methyltransferase [Candidatus Parvarchaeota archaeon]|nr:class I SAM-dependent methyltransferase [Candidatus Parvarchaeota archaeon]
MKGEERFGPLSSRLYSVFAVKGLAGMYSLAINDITRKGAGRILEVGAGPGDLAVKLAEMMPESEIYCIDPSKAMRNIGLKKIKERGLNNMKYFLGSSRNVPLKLKFDVIFSTLSFHHWKDKSGSIAYLTKFLKPNGSIMIYEYDKDKLKTMPKLFMGAHALSRSDIENLHINPGYGIKTLKKGNFVVLEIKHKNHK